MVLKNAALAGLVLFALLFRIDLYAQEAFAEIDLSSNNVDDIQAFEKGDSILLTYTDKHEIKGYWIDRGGDAFEIQFPRSATLPLCGITQKFGNTYVYYLHKVENQLTLKMLEQRQGTLSMTPYPFMTILEDEVVVAQSQNNKFFLITYRKPFNEVKVSVFEGSSILHERIFAMPINLNRYLKYSTGIMNERFATIEQGSGRLKFYIENNELIFTLDNMLDGQDSKTTIMWMDFVTGATRINEIHSPEHVRFSSFYYSNQLFRFVRKHDAVFVNIHRAETGDTLYSKTMTKKETVDAPKIFQRIGKTRRIEYRNFYPMYSADSELSILVEPSKNSNDVRIVFGNFENDKGTGFPIGFPDPATMLVGFVVSHAVARLSESPGISKHVFLFGNVSDGFEFEPIKENPKASARQVLDEYEMAQNDESLPVEERWYIYLLYKGYIETQDGVLGIYREKRNKSKKIVLLKYMPRG